MNWVFIIVGWIFLNIIVKLYVNAIERIYKENIDHIVSKTPTFFKVIAIEFFRIVNIIFFTPLLIILAFFWIFPRIGTVAIFREFKSEIDLIIYTLFSKEKFRSDVMKAFPFFIQHPLKFFKKLLFLDKNNKKPQSN
jgi:hypothetical protein